MAFNINDFTANLTFGGARAALFQVNITNPIDSIGDAKIQFMAKAASMPGMTLNQIPVSYFGRQIKLAGNRIVDDWTVTIINDEDFLIRNALEGWSNAINGMESNTAATSVELLRLYKSTAQVTQFSKTGVPIRTYHMRGIFPVNISPIDVNWEADAIQEYQVQFAVDWHEVSGITGTGGGR